MPAIGDGDALRRELVPLLERRDPTALRRACEAWLSVRADDPADVVNAARWQIQVANVLGWTNQPVRARELFTSAYRLLEERSHPHPNDAAQVAGFLGVLATQSGDQALALTWTQRALAHHADPRAVRDDRHLRQLRMNEASLLSTVRRFEDARQRFAALLAEARALDPPDALIIATALRGIAISYRREARNAEALAATEEEIAYRLQARTEDRLELGVAYQNRATIQMDLGDMTGAEASLRVALERTAGGTVDLLGHRAAVQETLAFFLTQRGRPLEAVDAASEAVSSIEAAPGAGPASPRAARALRRLADAQLAAGRIPDALAAIRRALAISDRFERPTDLDSEIAMRLTYARLQLLLGAPQAALAAADRARARVGDRPLAPTEAAALAMIRAQASSRIGDGPGALASLLSADQLLATRMRPGDGQRALVAAERCRLDAGACGAVEALLVPAATHVPAVEAQLLLALGGTPGRPVADRLAFTERATWAAVDAGVPQLVAQAFAEHARVLFEAGRVVEAVFFGKKSAAHVQAQRADIAAQVGRDAEAGYLSLNARVYRDLADWLAASGRVDEAVEVLQLLHLREYEDYVERANLRAGAADAQVRLTREETLLERIVAEELQARLERAAQAQRLRQRVQARRATAEEQEALRRLESQQTQSRAESFERWRAVLGRVEAQAAVRRAEGDAQAPPRAADAVGGLVRPEPGSLHAHFFLAQGRLTAIFVGAGSQQVRRLEVSESTLGRETASLLDALLAGQVPMARLQAMYRLVGQPLDEAAASAGATRVRMWLDGALRYLPMGLLHDGRRHLVEKYVLSHGVAATGDDAAPGWIAAGDSPRVQAFGVTRALSGMPALPMVADEVCAVVDGPLTGVDRERASPADCARDRGAPDRVVGRGALKGRGDLNEAFTEAALVRSGVESRPGDVLHIGTHFVLRPGNASHSWLLLGNGDRLTADRMRSLPLGRPGLVTLSACETAVPAEQADGRELAGLASLLAERGARRVVATLWKVEDRAAAALMRDFYAELRRAPADAEGALARAQRKALRTRSSSLGWGAFIVSAAGP